MFLSQQFRAKAAEYRELVKGTDVPSAVREFQKLERSFTELADNEDWLANNLDKTVHPRDNDGEEPDYMPSQ
jgi:hypothetical protein